LCELPHTIWTRSVLPFQRLSDTKQIYRTTFIGYKTNISNDVYRIQNKYIKQPLSDTKQINQTTTFLEKNVYGFYTNPPIVVLGSF